MEEKIITYDDIQKANEAIKTTDIKGKDYAEVNQRIKAFRMVHPNGDIDTHLISDENGVCKFRADIYDANGKHLGSGTAYEKENSTFINKTSYIENCETSAVGRALGMCGFGIDTSVASAEEVQNAMANQEEKPKKDKVETKKDTTDYKTLLADELKKRGNFVEFAKKYKLNAKTPQSKCKELLEQLLGGNDASGNDR